MGGKAVKDVRPLKQEEVKPTYQWVVENLLPIIGLTKDDAIPIGSFGKKPLNETSGDIDIAIDANKFIMEDHTLATLEYICEAIDCMIGEIEGYETTLLKGFDQVSVKVPICGDESNGYAQVDLMPSPDLGWAKFMYHSPNLAEGESKYKGAVRNALLMAILSESTKETTKLFEGKAEEYNSLAIRFPTGVWNIKRSFMGKKGKLVQKGIVLESEFITKDPQDVVDLAFGTGYGVRAANSFETLWEIMHRKDFIHKARMNEIMSKFKVNLKSMRQDTPGEAIEKYREILDESLSDVLQPKSQEDVVKAAMKIMKEEPGNYELRGFHTNGVLKMLDKDFVVKSLKRILDENAKDKNRWRMHERMKKMDWMKGYLPSEYWDGLLNFTKYYELIEKFRQVSPDVFGVKSYEDLPEYAGQTKKELSNLEKDLKKAQRKNELLPFLELVKGDLPHKSLSRIVRERIKKNQFGFFVAAYQYVFKDHPNSHWPMTHVTLIFPLVNKEIKDIPISDLKQGTSGSKVESLLHRLQTNGIIQKFKIGNKLMIKANPSYRDNEDYVSHNYYKFVKELYDKIEEYDIAELNESIKDLLKPKESISAEEARSYAYKLLPQMQNNQTPGILQELQKIIMYLTDHGYFFETTDNKVLWFKHVDRDPMQGGFIAIDGYKDLNMVKDYVERIEGLNEEFLGHAYGVQSPSYDTMDDPIGMHKNPERIDRFHPWVKAFLDIDGNVFIEDAPGDWLHKDMAEHLKSEGKLHFRGSFYDSPFVTLIRVGNSNNFAYTEGTIDSMSVRDMMAKAQERLPQYKFFAKHYEYVKNEV